MMQARYQPIGTAHNGKTRQKKFDFDISTTILGPVMRAIT